MFLGGFRHMERQLGGENPHKSYYASLLLPWSKSSMGCLSLRAFMATVERQVDSW